ncbi:MAG TPA: tetratricopeptide repeat protein, partial [Rhizomicrobium sp.]|nr:tetratricopeptide repeat protein [Rhizomicrobium sp.]
MNLFVRRMLLGVGLLSLTTLPTLSGIPISVAPGKQGTAMDEKALNDAMQNAFGCVAAVLSYRPAEAEPLCGSLILAAPEEALGYKFRGLAYLLEQRFEKAEEDFHTAVRIDPRDAENQAGYAQALAGQGRFAEAIPGFESALKLAPRDIRYLAASCWARAGEGSRLDLALSDCNKALLISPQFATALQNRGLVRLKQKNWRTAIQDYSRALVNDGDRPTALFGRGFASLQIGKLDDARDDIRAARRIASGIDDLYILQKVLPATCREARGPCPLPDDLRQILPRQAPLLTVSFQSGPYGHPSGFEELDETLRAIELGRLDAMLEHTAARLGVSFSPGF